MNNFIILVICSFMTVLGREPYDSVKLMPLNLEPNLFGNERQLTKMFEEIADKNAGPLTVIEIGCFRGRSTVFLGKKLAMQGGIVYAVDHWFGTPGWEKDDLKIPWIVDMYDQFLSNVIHCNLTDVIEPIRMSSLDAAKKLNILADLIYIDAAHYEDDVYNDIKAWLPKLKANGIICGDDWGYPSVQRALSRICNELNCQVYSEDNFWRLTT